MTEIRCKIGATDGDTTLVLPAVDAAGLNLLIHGDPCPDPTLADRLGAVFELAEDHVDEWVYEKDLDL